MTASKPTAIVTGASRGIGRAIAVRLAGSFHVVAAARTADALEVLARDIESAGGTCTPLPVDLTRAAEVGRAFGAIDAQVLVNNAGVGVLKPLTELSAPEWQTMIDVNVSALYHVTNAVLPSMLQRRAGHIVIIGSIGGRSAFVGGSCYAATKAFATAFAESLMLEVRDQGIKVSVVSPGSVATGFSSEPASWKLRPEDVAESVAAVLATPPNVLIHRLEIRSLAPKKK